VFQPEDVEVKLSPPSKLANVKSEDLTRFLISFVIYGFEIQSNSERKIVVVMMGAARIKGRTAARTAVFAA
jgi:hypothetical protein